MLFTPNSSDNNGEPRVTTQISHHNLVSNLIRELEASISPGPRCYHPGPIAFIGLR